LASGTRVMAASASVSACSPASVTVTTVAPWIW